MKLNPDAHFWQYSFREQETKTGHAVHSVLPRRLTDLLEAYLQYHPPVLLVGSDPGTLFVNLHGRPLTLSTVNILVGNLTLRYAQKRMTPHRFRDAFAHWWLKKHPQDYLTISKKLWHRNIQTTLRVYGCKFDESEADCRIEEYAESYEQNPEARPEMSRGDGESIEAIRNLISNNDTFQALPASARQSELSAIAGIIESHPWLAKLLGGELRKNAVSTAQGQSSGFIQHKSA
jgi:hypothetical protein